MASYALQMPPRVAHASRLGQKQNYLKITIKFEKDFAHKKTPGIFSLHLGLATSETFWSMQFACATRGGIIKRKTFFLTSFSPLIAFHPLWGYPGSSGSYRTIVFSGPYWIRLGT